MGFYDYRCGLTGVSLNGADTVLVPLLEGAGGKLEPLALALKGNYNRLGAIDGIHDDPANALLVEFFVSRLKTGGFAVDQEYLQGYGHYPVDNLDALVGALERNVTDYPKAAMLNGKSVKYALFSQIIWRVVAQRSPARAATLEEVLPGSPMIHIYAGHLDELTAQVAELASMKALMHARGIPWTSPEDPSQHYAEEMNGYIVAARSKFADSPMVLEGLLIYEHEVGEQLREEE